MKNTSRYFIIEDEIYEKEIIKYKENIFYRYVFGPNEWYKTNIFNDYYEKKQKDYYEVDKEQVKKIIVSQINFYQKLWNISYNLAIEKHSGQIDKAGKDYILHPLHISEQFEEFDLKIVAIMHDLIEDTNVTLDFLINLNFPLKIIKAMDAISRRNNENYFDYINRLKNNNIAKKVKIKDLEHNLDISRYKNSQDINYNLIKRYEKAMNILLY